MILSCSIINVETDCLLLKIVQTKSINYMLECWGKNNSIARKQPQAIMRDINQILYEVYNVRTHTYVTICPKFFRVAETMTRMAVFIQKKANQIVNCKRVWSLITLLLFGTIIVTRIKSF